MEDLRRLDIRLPVDHPIFTVPARQRGVVAREWMDVGKNLAILIDQNKQTSAEIMIRLDSLTREVMEIKTKQVVVCQEDQGLAVIIEDSPGKEIATDDFKIPTDVIKAFDNWGVDK